MTSYAIGDIQGCLPKLQELLKKIDERSPRAELIFVGDLVNRGPQSLETLRQVRDLGERAQGVLGNHDLHLLAVACGIRRAHRSDTLDSILEAPDRDQLLDWLRRRPLVLRRGDHLLLHAGVVPQWTAQQTLDLAKEVEAGLSGSHWIDFLRTMYGNTPARWDDALQGADRARCIINALTRIRFCSADGTMEFGGTKGTDADLPGYLRWFDVPDRKTQDVTIVFGHWSTLGLIMRPNLISLDTGCLWGGILTAVCLDDRAVLQGECPPYREPGAV